MLLVAAVATRWRARHAPRPHEPSEAERQSELSAPEGLPGPARAGEEPLAPPSVPSCDESDRELVASATPVESIAAVERAIVANERALTPRFPIVLAHGLLGFDSIGFGKLRREYFRGVPARLRALGVEVHVLRVPPLAAIRKRAEELARQIESLRAERVNIIAHSMGGLDARYAISQLGIASRVASLTTIGTPHHGAPLAAAGALLLRPSLRRVLATAGLDALYDLTPTSMARFNSEVLDMPGVEYACCVAFAPRVGASRQRLQLSLLPSAPGRTSDGLVPCDSQRWGAVLREIDADHWAQIGWSAHFDAASLYEDLVRMLGARGL